MNNTIPLTSKEFFENYESNLSNYLSLNIEHSEKSYITSQKSLCKAVCDAIEWQMKKVIDIDYRIKALSKHIFLEYSLLYNKRPYDEDKDRDDAVYNLILIYEKIDTFLEVRIQELNTSKVVDYQPETKVIKDTSRLENIKVFDPNHFNNDCHNLFNYLVENYSKKGKVKFINIYYFLKDEVDKQKYSFNFIQDDYTIFIKAKHQIEIKKYQKAEYDFIEQKRILNSHEQQFRKQ
ncbi:MAG: hypothetical protein H7Y10_03355 [Flavobacterium sp.]|nr:hypothetical protein [Flavobacterium sp.]